MLEPYFPCQNDILIALQVAAASMTISELPLLLEAAVKVFVLGMV
jgi:hypothetical protein